MNEAVAQRWMTGAAIAVFVAGLFLAAGAARRNREAAGFLREQARVLAAFDRLAGELDRYESARAAYENVPGGRAVRLETILRDAIEEERIEDARETRTEIGNGWSLRRKEAILSETAMSNVMSAVRGAEAQRPPWLLAECVIRAAPLAPGHGRAVLTFEVLERSSAASP